MYTKGSKNPKNISHGYDLSSFDSNSINVFQRVLDAAQKEGRSYDDPKVKKAYNNLINYTNQTNKNLSLNQERQKEFAKLRENQRKGGQTKKLSLWQRFKNFFSRRKK